MSEPTIPKIFERILRVAEPDEEAGTFAMILATEGEAADGHILEIGGGSVPARMPLLVNHENSPKETIGSILNPRKHLTDAPPTLTATGRVEMHGEGGPAEVRRDLMLMISRGHVNSISLRWIPDAQHAIRRTELPKDHPHHVDGEKDVSAKRYGYLFRRWRAVEGSVVAVGSDPAALILRAEETAEPVSSFLRSFAAQAKPEEPAPAPAPVEPDAASLLAAFAAQVREMQARGIDAEALALEVDRIREPKPTTDIGGVVADQAKQIEALRVQLAAFEDRVRGEPVPPLRSLKAIFERFDARMEQVENRAVGVVQAAVDARRGKVTPAQGYRQSLNAEVTALLRSKDPTDSVADLAALLDQFEQRIQKARIQVAGQEKQQ